MFLSMPSRVFVHETFCKSFWCLQTQVQKIFLSARNHWKNCFSKWKWDCRFVMIALLNTNRENIIYALHPVSVLQFERLLYSVNRIAHKFDWAIKLMIVICLPCLSGQAHIDDRFDRLEQLLLRKGMATWFRSTMNFMQTTVSGWYYSVSLAVLLGRKLNPNMNLNRKTLWKDHVVELRVWCMQKSLHLKPSMTLRPSRTFYLNKLDVFCTLGLPHWPATFPKCL